MSEAVGRELSNPSPENGHTPTTLATAAASNRYSFASDETGESSKQNDIIVDPPINDHDALGSSPTTHTSLGHGRGSHRSHKSKGSGGFLLSGSTFDLPLDENHQSKPTKSNSSKKRNARKDNQGKVPSKSHTRQRSPLGLGIGGSPLASNVANVDHAHNDSHDNEATPGFDGGQGAAAEESKELDVDSRQIVNLALNLSESRRLASRRATSTPLPPSLSGFGEGFAGSSLRTHLQAQRRTSRNISPKPERGERHFSATARTGIHGERSPLQSSFNTEQEDAYHYQFSASTLARAQKAKNAIELMAQYRRLLQYLPPLKPDGLSRATTFSPPSTSAGSPRTGSLPISRTYTATISRPVGRAYNPLQYIRNRKVRNRERQPIDGEAQGFGDVSRVTSWVDQIAKDAMTEGYDTSDCVILPQLPSNPIEATLSRTATANSTPVKNQIQAQKNKRPRVDWMINPPDMLADIEWLEKNDNKKLIEDNRERKIFPQNLTLIRTVSRKEDEPEESSKAEEEVQQQKPERSLYVDTKLPVFNSLRRGRRDSTGNKIKIRDKLQDVAHELESAGHEHHILPRVHARSDYDSSDSDTVFARDRHRRSNTADSEMILSTNILEKQMQALAASESRDDRNGTSEKSRNGSILPSIEREISPRDTTGLEREISPRSPSKQPSPESEINKRGQRGSGQLGDSRPTSARASLEVPGHRSRHSWDTSFDSTAPNSPESKPTRLLGVSIPGISMDISPPSRPVSPNRQPALARVRSKITKFHERNRSRDTTSRRHSTPVDGDGGAPPSVEGSSASPENRVRSPSPARRFMPRKIDDSLRSQASRTSTLERDKNSSGRRGLFRSGRHPVSILGDFVFGKDGSQASEETSDDSGNDTDTEDSDDDPSRKDNEALHRRQQSRLQKTKSASPSQKPKSFLSEMPTFRSPFAGRDTEARGRTSQVKDLDIKHLNITAAGDEGDTQPQQPMNLLKPPRIDIQSASDSPTPDFASANISAANSDVSDTESRQTLSRVTSASVDARLNSILGLPGVLAPLGTHYIPITGLAALDTRRASSISQHSWSPSSPNSRSVVLSRREIARVRALLLASGIKAQEITRRANKAGNLDDKVSGSPYADIAALAHELAGQAGVCADVASDLIKNVPRVQEHILAAQILTTSIQVSSRLWSDSATRFRGESCESLASKLSALQERLRGPEGLSELARKAGDEADELSSEMMGGEMIRVKDLGARMNTMMRRRRRRFRWLRRAGWVAVEWVLVGVMWWVWLVVVLIRAVVGVAKGLWVVGRWLLWLS
jgi:hypothetical protein